MKGLNHQYPTADEMTKLQSFHDPFCVGQYEVITHNSLIAINCFLDEIGMHRNGFMRLRKLGRVEGLVTIANKIMVDRRKIYISFKQYGENFRQWIALGGRIGPVNVKLNKAYEPPISVKEIEKGL